MVNWIKKNKKNIITGNIIFAWFSFMLFFFAPLEIYLADKDSYYFGGSEIVPFAFLFMICSIIGLDILNFFLIYVNEHLSKAFYTILFSFTLAIYVYGTYFVADYGVLDGTPIKWADHYGEIIFSWMLFVIIGVGVYVIAYRINRTKEKFDMFMRYISVCITLIQVITLGTLFITKGLDKPEKYYSLVEGEYELSNEKNMIVLLLDTYDSAVFDELITEEDYKNIFADFTYFPDTVGSYAGTDLALPQIITGQGYQNDTEYGNYLTEAYSDSYFFNKLCADNWDVGIYLDATAPQGEVADRTRNVQKTTITVSSHKRLATVMYRLVGFRYLPYPFKEICWFYPADELNSMKCTDDQHEEVFEEDNFLFYEGIEGLVTDCDKNAFRFYHLQGTHIPFTITADFQNTGTETSIREEARGMMVLIEKFLEKMKQLGIYENSIIVIMADHGYYDLRSNPLFLVKGMNEMHEFRVDDTPISFFDLQNAFSELLDGKTADEIFERENSERVRLYYSYEKFRTMDLDSYSVPIKEYEVHGHARNIQKYYESGRVFTK